MNIKPVFIPTDICGIQKTNSKLQNSNKNNNNNNNSHHDGNVSADGSVSDLDNDVMSLNGSATDKNESNPNGIGNANVDEYFNEEAPTTACNDYYGNFTETVLTDMGDHGYSILETHIGLSNPSKKNVNLLWEDGSITNYKDWYIGKPNSNKFCSVVMIDCDRISTNYAYIEDCRFEFESFTLNVLSKIDSDDSNDDTLFRAASVSNINDYGQHYYFGIDIADNYMSLGRMNSGSNFVLLTGMNGVVLLLVTKVLWIVDWKVSSLRQGALYSCQFEFNSQRLAVFLSAKM